MHSEGIGYPLQLTLLDADDVKAAGRLTSPEVASAQEGQEIVRCPDQAPALGGIDAGARPAMTGSCSQSYFHEDKHRPGPGDEIDLAPFPAQVACEDFQTSLFQMLRGQRFSLCAQQLRRRGCAARDRRPRWLPLLRRLPHALPGAYGLSDAFCSVRIQSHAGDGRLAGTLGMVRHNGRKCDQGVQR